MFDLFDWWCDQCNTTQTHYLKGKLDKLNDEPLTYTVRPYLVCMECTNETEMQ